MGDANAAKNNAKDSECNNYPSSIVTHFTMQTERRRNGEITTITKNIERSLCNASQLFTKKVIAVRLFSLLNNVNETKRIDARS